MLENFFIFTFKNIYSCVHVPSIDWIDMFIGYALHYVKDPVKSTLPVISSTVLLAWPRNTNTPFLFSVSSSILIFFKLLVILM